MNTWEARKHNVGQINVSMSIEKASEYKTHFSAPRAKLLGRTGLSPTMIIYDGDQEIRYIGDTLYCPPREKWNGSFRTPAYINGQPISNILNYIRAQTDTGHHWYVFRPERRYLPSNITSSRRGDCGTTTARCYNQLGHMSWCVFWEDHQDTPCGARVRNEKGYCEFHSSRRPRDYETWDEKMAREMAEANPPQDNDAVNEEQDTALDPEGNNDARVADENHAEAGQLQDQDALIEQEPDTVHFEEDYLRYQPQAQPFQEKRKKAAKIATKDRREQEKNVRVEAEIEAIQKKHKNSIIAKGLIAAKKGFSKLRR